MSEPAVSPGVYVADHVSPNPLVALLRYRALLANLIVRDIKVRYKRSVLGFAWMWLNPLISMPIFTLVFSHAFAFRPRHYSLYVVAGLLAWNLFALGTAQGMRSVVNNGALMRKVYVPKAAFPIAAVTSSLVNFLFSLVPLFLYMAVIGVPFSLQLVWLPWAIATLYMFALGIALILGTFNVLFRDVQFFYEAALSAWFYATPIFYPPEIIPASYRFVLALNPMYSLIQAFREPIYNGQPPGLKMCLTSLVVGGLTLYGGWRIFHRFEGRFINFV
jgi:ABC-type polysaccharide/polyol phosphate export permease